MPETVEYLQDSAIILVVSSGQTSIDDWRSSLSQVIRIHHETGAKSVLVDVRKQQTTPGTTDIFQFGKDLPADIRFAVVTSEVTKSDQSFLETVAKNRAKLIQMFNSYDEAVDWLQENT
ncbi:MAG: hypothetical protein QNJ69_03475 [Gammaproteobacteria bacterium]|nr:hypothetical protein [Gammaproteobacteria bacterium]